MMLISTLCTSDDADEIDKVHTAFQDAKNSEELGGFVLASGRVPQLIKQLADPEQPPAEGVRTLRALTEFALIDSQGLGGQMLALGVAPLVALVRRTAAHVKVRTAAVQVLGALSAQHGAPVSAHLLKVGLGVVLKELLDLAVADELIVQAAVLVHNLAEAGAHATKLLQCGVAGACTRLVATADLGAQTKEQLVIAVAALACARGGARAVNALADHALPTLAVHLAGGAADAADDVASPDAARAVAAASARDAATREGVKCLHIIAESSADGSAAQRLSDVPGVFRALQAAAAHAGDDETKHLAQLTITALNEATASSDMTTPAAPVALPTPKPLAPDIRVPPPVPAAEARE